MKFTEAYYLRGGVLLCFEFQSNVIDYLTMSPSFPKNMQRMLSG